MTTLEPRAKTWTRAEYHRLGDQGWFRDRRVQLIEGAIVEMSPQRSAHAATVALLHQVLQEAWGSGVHVRCQLPLALGEASEPEPDAAVVEGPPQDYFDAYPRAADLVVEVADASLAYDRREKRSLYAKACIAEYWIVNLPERRLEVYRRPEPDDAAPFGSGYAERAILTPGESVEPLGAPSGASIAVGRLLR